MRYQHTAHLLQSWSRGRDDGRSPPGRCFQVELLGHIPYPPPPPSPPAAWHERDAAVLVLVLVMRRRVCVCGEKRSSRSPLPPLPPPLAVGECGRCLFFSGALWSEQHRRGCGAVREGGGGRQREEERWGGGTNAAQPAVISFHTPARSRHTSSLLPYPSVNTLRSSPAPPTLLTEQPPTPPRCLLLSLRRFSSSLPSLPSLFVNHLRSGHRGTALPTNLAFDTAGGKVQQPVGYLPPQRMRGFKKKGGTKKEDVGDRKGAAGGGWKRDYHGAVTHFKRGPSHQQGRIVQLPTGSTGSEVI